MSHKRRSSKRSRRSHSRRRSSSRRRTRRSRRSRSRRRSRRLRRSRSPAKGWKSSRKVGSREKLYEKCGSKCFLLPSERKFPVCKSNMCKVSCSGLVAAKSRAGEWKYRNVYNKADRLIRQKGCTMKSRQ